MKYLLMFVLVAMAVTACGQRVYPKAPTDHTEDTRAY